MKLCLVISGFYIDGPAKEDGAPPDRIEVKAGTSIDLPDDVADYYDSIGWVDALSHNGTTVVWGSCCGGH